MVYLIRIGVFFFEEQLAKNPYFQQKAVMASILGKNFFPRLNYRSLTFYTTLNQDKNDLSQIQQVIDATNTEYESFSNRLRELKKREDDDKKKDEDTKKKLFK